MIWKQKRDLKVPRQKKDSRSHWTSIYLISQLLVFEHLLCISILIHVVKDTVIKQNLYSKIFNMMRKIRPKYVISLCIWHLEECQLLFSEHGFESIGSKRKICLHRKTICHKAQVVYFIRKYLGSYVLSFIYYNCYMILQNNFIMYYYFANLCN